MAAKKIFDKFRQFLWLIVGIIPASNITTLPAWLTNLAIGIVVRRVEMQLIDMRVSPRYPHAPER